MRNVLFIFSLCLLLGAAQNDDVNTLIDAIVQAPPEQRFEKMNAFKLKMRELNRQQRLEALNALRAKAYPDLDPAVTLSPKAAAQQEYPTADGAVGTQQMRMQQQQMQRQQMQPGNGGSGGGNTPKQPQQQQPQQHVQPQQPLLQQKAK